MPNPGPKCIRHKSNGEPCPNSPMKGQQVCSTHGGLSPQAKKAAARRLAEVKALKLLKVEGRPEPVTEPTKALMELAGEAIAFKEILSEHVAKLNEMRYEGKAGEQIRGELEAYERALDRAEHFCNNLAKLNLEERRVKVEQAQVLLVTQALDAAMAQAGLDQDESQRVLDELRKRLI